MPNVVTPETVGTAAEQVAAAATEEELEAAVERCPIPMVVVDGERRYTYGNGPARLAFHLSLADLRAREIGDLSPPSMRPVMDQSWRRLLDAGVETGTYEVATPDGGLWEVVYYAVSTAVPDRHLIAFSPADWPAEELDLAEPDRIQPIAASASQLTAREREIVELLARGLTGEEIAVRLEISPDTTRTHIRNALRGMGAKTRAHLIALAYGVLDPEPPTP